MRTILGLLILICIGACLTAEEPVKVSNKDCQCEMSFPGKPEFKDTASGGTYTFRPEVGLLTYRFMYFNYAVKQIANDDVKAIKPILDDAQEYLVKLYQGKLIKSEEDSLSAQKYVSRMIELDARDYGYVRARLIFANNNYAFMEVIGDKLATQGKEAQAFLNSFKLSGKSDTVPVKPEPVKPAAPVAPGGESEKITCLPGQCEITFPGKPEVVKDQRGERYQYANTVDKREYMFRWDGGKSLNPTAEEIALEVQGMQKLLSQKLNAQVYLATESTYGEAKYPMYTIQLTQGSSRYLWRCIRARGGLYQVVVKEESTPMLEEAKGSPAQVFFDSFKLLGKSSTTINGRFSNFEIVFPDKPQANIEKDSERYQLSPGKDLFMLDCNRAQKVLKEDTQIQLYLEGLQKSLSDKLGGKVTKVTNGMLTGTRIPLRTIHLEIQDDKGETIYYRWRLIYQEGCLYQVVVGGARETVEGKEADAFLESFKIVPMA